MASVTLNKKTDYVIAHSSVYLTKDGDRWVMNTGNGNEIADADCLRSILQKMDELESEAEER